MRIVAWSVKAYSNGSVYQWSRWHWMTEAESASESSKTLCGKPIPRFQIWIDPPNNIPRDFRIRGVECQECKKLAAKERKSAS